MNIEMKELQPTEPETADQKNRTVSILLPYEAADRLERIAQSKGTLVDRVIHQLIIEYVTRESESLQDRIGRGVRLIESLIATAKDELMQVAIAGTVGFQERQRKRDRLVELGLRAFEELAKISDSEQLARQAEFRLRAFLVLARLGAFTDAVIHNQDEADVLDLLERAEEAHKQLEEQMKKVKAKEDELEKSHRKTG